MICTFAANLIVAIEIRSAVREPAERGGAAYGLFLKTCSGGNVRSHRVYTVYGIR